MGATGKPKVTVLENSPGSIPNDRAIDLPGIFAGAEEFLRGNAALEHAAQMVV
jgi:hypothetical protein